MNFALLIQLTIKSLLFAYSAFAQKEAASRHNLFRNTVYLEVLGSGGLWSVNYDKLLLLSDRFAVNPRIGFTLNLLPTTPEEWKVALPVTMAIPIRLGGVDGNFDHTGKQRIHFLELGAGVIAVVDDFTLNEFVITGLFMFRRYCSANRRLVLRIGATPFLADTNTDDDRLLDWLFFPWGGLSAGYAF